MTLWRTMYIDKTTGEPSSSKFWANFGLLVLCVAVIVVASAGALDPLLVVAFGAIVCGNALASRIIDRVMPAKSGDDGEPQS